jgi:hypothetical protein
MLDNLVIMQVCEILTGMVVNLAQSEIWHTN